MSHLFFRIFNHVIKTLARPAINWLTHYKKAILKEKRNSKGPVLVIVKSFVYLGQLTNKINIKINKKIFNIKSLDETKLLAEDKALEKGIETFSEGLIYLLILSIPIYEYTRISAQAKEQTEGKKCKIQFMENELLRLSNRNCSLREQIAELGDSLNSRIAYLESQKNIKKPDANTLI